MLFFFHRPFPSRLPLLTMANNSSSVLIGLSSSPSSSSSSSSASRSLLSLTALTGRRPAFMRMTATCASTNSLKSL